MVVCVYVFVLSSRRRHTRCALVTGVQTCALPISIGVRPGPLMAAADQAFLTVRGKGAHAARPQDGIDPIAVGVQLYHGIQTIVSRNVDPLKSAVITVAQFHAGTATNVIPATAALKLSIRTFDDGVRNLIEQRLRAHSDGVGRMFG